MNMFIAFAVLFAAIFCVRNPFKKVPNPIKLSYFESQRAAMGLQKIPNNLGKYRFMTYNTENLKKFEAVIDTVRKSRPTVISMQEVPMTKFKIFLAKMEQEGFNYHAKCENFRISGVLANVIFAKVPITKHNSYNLRDPYGNRCVVEALVGTGLNQILLVGTHLTNAKGKSSR
jgi:hypothetical protein